MPTIERSFGAHRRYSPAELHTLRLMRNEIARGKRASLAAETVLQLVSIAGPAAEYIAKILDASERSDTEAVQAHLTEASTDLGPGPCLDEVMLPAMQQVGRWWQAGRCTIEDEHTTTSAVRDWLRTLSAAAPAPTHGKSIVLACGPTDSHTLGLEGLGLLLRREGWDCHLLGPRTPVEDVTAALRTRRSRGRRDRVPPQQRPGTRGRVAARRRRRGPPAVLRRQRVHRTADQALPARAPTSAPDSRTRAR